jgi:hypothetical protein
MRGRRSGAPDNNRAATAGHSIKVCETQMLKTMETAAPYVSHTAARVSLASRELAPGRTSTKFGHVIVQLRAALHHPQPASQSPSQNEVV